MDNREGNGLVGGETKMGISKESKKPISVQHMPITENAILLGISGKLDQIIRLLQLIARER